MRPRAVLHVTALHGGGVDRHVRDIARSTQRPHVFWHVGEAAEVIEIPAERHFAVIDPRAVDGDTGAVGEWLAARDVGLVHMHTLVPRARSRAQQACGALGTGYVTTLHDVLFLRRDAFEHGASIEPDPAWLEGHAPFLRASRAVVAPSEFIAGLARRHLPGLEVQVVPNGVEPPSKSRGSVGARPEFARERPEHVVAVLGAIGPHKGSELLESLAAELAGSGIALVVIGYLDRQLTPGWRAPGTFFIHGTYQDDEVAALLHAYGARVALFPNRVAESFSYALSDIWASGVPVLASPFGALGERIAAHGGGWLLPPDFDAALVARRLRELFSPAMAGELARVESLLSHPDPARVPPLAPMARSLDALYERFGIDPAAPVRGDSQAIDRLLAANLDGSVFRVELARIADEYAQLAQAHESALASSQRFETESREWIAKLEADVASLTRDVEREVAQRRALGEEIARLGPRAEAFGRLPAVVRRWLLRKARDARS